MVRFETSHGGFTVELYDEDAPQTVENFLRYVDDRFFDGTIFHRIVPGFVIQGAASRPTTCRRRPTRRYATRPQRRTQRTRHAVDGAHRRDPQRHLAVFVNLADNEFSTSDPASTATRCSAASPKAWI